MQFSENHCDMPGGSVKMSGFAGLAGAPGKVVCTFLRLIAERGISSTAMGFVDLGLGVVIVAGEGWVCWMWLEWGWGCLGEWLERGQRGEQLF